MDNLEYSYHDEAMAELGMTPSEAELIVPKFVITDRAKEIKYWAEQMEMAKSKMEQDGTDVRVPVSRIFRPFSINFLF